MKTTTVLVESVSVKSIKGPLLVENFSVVGKEGRMITWDFDIENVYVSSKRGAFRKFQ